MIIMCPCIIDFMGGMDYEGEWGGGGPSLAPFKGQGVSRDTVFSSGDLKCEDSCQRLK
jgi:hypothetical protein